MVSGDTTLPTGRALPTSRTGVTLMGGGEATRVVGDTTRSLCGANGFGDAARAAATSATKRRAPDLGEGRRKALPTPGRAGAPRGVPGRGWLPGRGTRRGRTRWLAGGSPGPVLCVSPRLGRRLGAAAAGDATCRGRAATAKAKVTQIYVRVEVGEGGVTSYT